MTPEDLFDKEYNEVMQRTITDHIKTCVCSNDVLNASVIINLDKFPEVVNVIAKFIPLATPDAFQVIVHIATLDPNKTDEKEVDGVDLYYKHELVEPTFDPPFVGENGEQDRMPRLLNIMEMCVAQNTANPVIKITA